jgi:hypothetical protein
MTEQEHQQVSAVFRALRRSYDALEAHLREHPATPELLLIQAAQFTAFQNLKPLLEAEVPEEQWQTSSVSKPVPFYQEARSGLGLTTEPEGQKSPQTLTSVSQTWV